MISAAQLDEDVSNSPGIKTPFYNKLTGVITKIQ